MFDPRWAGLQLRPMQYYINKLPDELVGLSPSSLRP
jgi:hypothetical protein